MDALDPLFVALSGIGILGGVWIALAALAALLWRRPYVLPFVVAGVLVADGLALVLKLIVGRRRPYVANPDPEPLMHTPLDLSLPSGHAATSFAGAALLAAFVPRLAGPLFLLAAAVAWSRVYVGVHYPADILAGALLGLAVAAVFVLAERRWPRTRAATAPRSPGATPRRSRQARPRG